MPVEEAVTGGIIRVIVWFVMDIFFGALCWGIGWLILKVLSLGTYPSQDTKSGPIIATGLSVLLIVITALMIYIL